MHQDLHHGRERDPRTVSFIQVESAVPTPIAISQWGKSTHLPRPLPQPWPRLKLDNARRSGDWATTAKARDGGITIVPIHRCGPTSITLVPDPKYRRGLRPRAERSTSSRRRHGGTTIRRRSSASIVAGRPQHRAADDTRCRHRRRHERKIRTPQTPPRIAPSNEGLHSKHKTYCT
jgi:hypothetical protein